MRFHLVRLLVAGVVFGLCISYVATTFAWVEIAVALRGADLPLLLLGGYGSILLVWLARTARWQLLLSNLGLRTAFRDLYFCTALALGLAVVTPMQSGEMLKLQLLKRSTPIDLTRSLATFAAERVADIVVLAVFTVVAVPLQPAWPSSLARVAGLAAIVVGSALVLQLPVGSRLLPERPRRFARALRGCAGTTPGQATLLGLTLFCWCATALGWRACLASVGVDIDFMQAVALVCLVTLVNVLSLVPGGLGVSEVGVTAFLVQLGVPLAQAQTGALIIRVYGLMFLTLSLLHWPAAKTRASATPG